MRESIFTTTIKKSFGNHLIAGLIIGGSKEANVNTVQQEKYTKVTNNITTDYLKDDYLFAKFYVLSLLKYFEIIKLI